MGMNPCVKWVLCTVFHKAAIRLMAGTRLSSDNQLEKHLLPNSVVIGKIQFLVGSWTVLLAEDHPQS